LRKTATLGRQLGDFVPEKHATEATPPPAPLVYTVC